MNSIAIEPLQEKYASDLVELWRTRHEEAIAEAPFFPRKWLTDPSCVASFIRGSAGASDGVVALMGKVAVGYLVGQGLQSHGECAAYCPVQGHAALEQYEEAIYRRMYSHLSGQWVSKGQLSHLLTYYARDKVMTELLFSLGFGLVGVDAVRGVDPLPKTNTDVRIREAGGDDIGDVMRLGEKSREFYLEAPTFLARAAQDRQHYQRLLDDDSVAIFLAYHEGELVGLMDINDHGTDDICQLVDAGTATIDSIGPYILPEHRGRGIGASLLQKAIEWCRGRNLERVAVDFESANPYASGFWPKHFRPILHSVRRRANQDICGSRSA